MEKKVIMELQNGICFLCSNKKVIKSSQSQEMCKLTLSLFSEEIVNFSELKKVQSFLKFCPICYHKLVLLKRIGDNWDLDSSDKEVLGSNCRLCSSEQNLCRINNWTNFTALAENTPISKNVNCVTCTDCLFSMEIKCEIKNKLFLKYPQVQNKGLNNNETKRKWQLKFTKNARLHSPSLPVKIRNFQSKNSSLSNGKIYRRNETSQKGHINFDSIKKLQPLRHNILMRNYEVVNNDPKLLNQVPYVLINVSNSPNESDKKYDDNKMCNERNRRNCSRRNYNTNSVNLKNKLCHNGSEKHLVINVLKMDMENYHTKTDYNREIVYSTSVEKSDILENITTQISKEDNSTNTSEKDVDEIETNVEVKSKRKSVSFAEEKNVEIEYFDNESDISLKNHSSLDDSFEAAGKKYSKGILKRDENREKSENKELLKVPDYKNTENNEHTNKRSSKSRLSKRKRTKKIRDSLNDSLIENASKNLENISISDDSSEECEIMKQTSLDNIIYSLETDLEKSNGNTESSDCQFKIKIKRSKPKPLSKKKKHHSKSEKIVTDNDIDVDSSMYSQSGDDESKLENCNIPNDTTQTVNNENKNEERESPCIELSTAVADADEHQDISEQTASEKNEEAQGEQPQQLFETDEEISNSQQPESDTPSINADVEDSTNEDEIVDIEDSSIREELTSSGKTLENEERCIEFPEEDTLCENDTDSITSTNIDENYKSIPENEVSLLVGKYLVDEDKGEKIFLGTEEKDETLTKTASHNNCNDETNKFDDDCQKIDIAERSDSELGISEVDTENISSILSHIFPVELPDEDAFDKNESRNSESASDTEHGFKRKRSEDDLDSTDSSTQNKKKVKFCEDVT